MASTLASPMTIKRIHREVADVAKEDLGQITLAPSSCDLFLWKATIPGPQGSVYEGGVYNVDIQLGRDYPFSAPKVTFVTRIYHMNISDRGHICIDILKSNWSPALSLFKVVLSLSSLLTDPNPSDPLVHSIATEYLRNRKQHDDTARRWTSLYAQPPPPKDKVSVPNGCGTRTDKGKHKDDDENTSLLDEVHDSDPGIGGSASSVTTAGETIVISDSEGETQQGVGTRRTRNGTNARRKRKQVEVVDIAGTAMSSAQTSRSSAEARISADSTDESDTRRNKRGRKAGGSDTVRSNEAVAGSVKRQRSSVGHVIVIED